VRVVVAGVTSGCSVFTSAEVDDGGGSDVCRVGVSGRAGGCSRNSCTTCWELLLFVNKTCTLLFQFIYYKQSTANEQTTIFTLSPARQIIAPTITRAQRSDYHFFAP
jgi:hypothetical protein